MRFVSHLSRLTPVKCSVTCMGSQIKSLTFVGLFYFSSCPEYEPRRLANLLAIVAPVPGAKKQEIITNLFTLEKLCNIPK